MSDTDDVTPALTGEVDRIMAKIVDRVDISAEDWKWVGYAIAQMAVVGVRVGAAHIGASVIENATRLREIEGLTAAEVLHAFENLTMRFSLTDMPLPNQDD